jgi:hypothetical protein
MTTPIKHRKMAEIRAVVNSSSSFEEKKVAVKEIMKYGVVPKVYAPHKDALKPTAEPGLSTLIENAMTPQEVKNLLMKGQLDYKKASAKTIRKWQKIAANRIAELSK